MITLSATKRGSKVIEKNIIEAKTKNAIKAKRLYTNVKILKPPNYEFRFKDNLEP